MTTPKNHLRYAARRHALLACLAVLAIAGTRLSAPRARMEEREVRRLLAAPHWMGIAGLDDRAREDLCWDLMSEAKIKKLRRRKRRRAAMDTGRATPLQKAWWKAMKCEKVLSLFKPKVLGYGDTLRPEVSQSTMALKDQRTLHVMAQAVMAHLKERGIRFAPEFGTLLGIVRNGVAVVPWDDDIDLVVDNRDLDFMSKLTSGLKKAKKNQVKGPKGGLKGAWELPGGYILYYKTDGCPWKIHPKGRGYPIVDLWPFKKKPDAPELNLLDPKMIRFGHVHKFEKPDTWYGNMTKTVAVKFSVDVPDLLEFPVPDDTLASLVYNFGEDALTQCKVSFIHSQGCKFSKTECERAKHSRMQRLQFPCVLLPETLHGMTLVNERSKVPREEAVPETLHRTTLVNEKSKVPQEEAVPGTLHGMTSVNEKSKVPQEQAEAAEEA